MKCFWDHWGESVKEFRTTLKPLGDEIAKQFTAAELTKSWKEFAGMLETDMEWIKSGVEWAQKLGKAFDDSADAVERFGKALRGADLTKPNPVKHDNLGQGDWDARKEFPGTAPSQPDKPLLNVRAQPESARSTRRYGQSRDGSQLAFIRALFGPRTRRLTRSPTRTGCSKYRSQA